jgi:Sec-independent protein translocase protein TatA
MMELSNSDVDIPDCSMFMESTFFQEADKTPPAAAPSPADPNAKPAEGDATKKEETKVPTEEERKKYNSQNQFRQMNKKGNIEHIVVSILLFIPRLLGFLIQALVKLVKKIKNGDSKEKAQKADNATPEEKAAAAKEMENNKGKALSENVKVDENGNMTASAKSGDGDTVLVVTVNQDGTVSSNIPIEDWTNEGNRVVEVAAKIAENAESGTAVAGSYRLANEQEFNKQNQTRLQNFKQETFVQARDRRTKAATEMEGFIKELERVKANVEAVAKKIENDNTFKTKAGIDLTQVVKARKEDAKMLSDMIKKFNEHLQAINAVATMDDMLLDQYLKCIEKDKTMSNKMGNAANEDADALEKGKQQINSGKAPTSGFNINPVYDNAGNLNTQPTKGG